MITKGVWGYGALSNYDDVAPLHPKGWHIQQTWKDIKPTKAGPYNWALIIGWLTDLEADGLHAGLFFTVDDGAPDWVMTEAGSFTTDDPLRNGPYPYPFNPVYKNYMYQFHKDIFDFIKTLPANLKPEYVQVNPGSTGDKFFYKGNPIGYNWGGKTSITDAEFVAYERDLWAWCNSCNQQNEPDTVLLLSPGNDGEDLEFINSAYPNAMTKTGITSHNYGYTGDAVIFARNTIDRGEIQQIWQSDEWQAHALRNSAALVTSACAAKLDMFNTPSGYVNQNTDDTRPTDFFNKYADCEAEGKGFCLLRRVIDMADIVKYPEDDADYKPLIDPARITQYNRRIQNINKTTVGESYKAYHRAQAIEDFLNPARKTKFLSVFGPKGALYDNTGIDRHNHDYNIVSVQNYERGISQVNIDSVVAKWRVTSDQYHGRYAVAFDQANGLNEIFMETSEITPDHGYSYKVKIWVTYLDSGTGTLHINTFSNVKKVIGTITKANSGNWIMQEFTIDDYEPGGKLEYGADFTVKQISGDDTTIELIEFETVEENVVTNTAPVVEAGADIEIVDGDVLQLDGTVVDAEDNIEIIIVTKLSGPDCVITDPDNPKTTITDYEPGDYQFEITAVDSDGLSRSDIVNVTIVPQTPPDMPVITILEQPVISDLKAAYRPIVFRIKARSTQNAPVPPVVYCDIYVNDIFYKTISKTQAAQIFATDSDWLFDIQDACQEVLTKYLGANGGSTVLSALGIMATVYCKFRSSGTDGNFIVPEPVVPVQATGTKPALPGTGLQSNSFFVVNCTLQHEDNQVLKEHLNAMKQNTVTPDYWSATTYPLTHRPKNYFIGKNDSDYFPFVNLETASLTVLRLKYKQKGINSWQEKQVSLGAVSLLPGIAYMPAGTKNLIKLFPDTQWRKIDSYYVELWDIAGNLLAITGYYKIIFDADKQTRLHFLNYLGTYDAVSFQTRSVVHESLTQQTFRGPITNVLAKTDRSIVRGNVRGNDTFSVTTTDYNEEQMNWAQELIDSVDAYGEWSGTQNQDDNYRPVVINDGKMDKVKSRGDFEYVLSVEFKLANETQTIRN